MRKIFFKINSFILAIFLIFNLFVYNLNFVNVNASENSKKYEDDTDLNSLDMSLMRDILKLNHKDPTIMDEVIRSLSNLEKIYIKAGNKLLKPFKRFYSKYIRGDRGFVVSRTFDDSWKFYVGEYEQIKEYKKLVKEYNIRKSVDEKTLNYLINNKIISDNDEFNRLFKKWSNKILDYIVKDESKDLSKYQSFKIKDLQFWYLKEDIQYLYLPDVVETSKKVKNLKQIDIGYIENPESGINAIFTNRIMIKADQYDMYWENINKLYESFKEPWSINSCFQIPEDFYLNFDKKFNNLSYGSYIPGEKFMMFGSSDLNNPNENFGLNDIVMKHYYDGSEFPNLIVKYHKFLVRLPDNKFKIAYIVDFDGNREINTGDYDLNGKSRFSEYFPKILDLKKDDIYHYFKYCHFYDYDLNNKSLIETNINDVIKPYKSEDLDNKELLKKVNNIDDYLHYLANNLNYDKYFNDINKRLDNYDGLFLKFDKKLNFIIDKLNKFKLFDYKKLNQIVHDNLEEFNKRYIQGISKDLKYITNLVRENKIEIIKNNDEIVNVYNKLNRIESAYADNSKLLFGMKNDIEYIKANLKSSDQIKADDDFISKFKNKEFNRVDNTLNFLDKFFNFFKDFFVVTEEFNFKKIDTSKLGKKIPFSIFHDFISIFKKLAAPPKVPKFDFPIYTEKFVIDFDKFEELAVIVRSFVILNFIILVLSLFFKKVG